MYKRIAIVAFAFALLGCQDATSPSASVIGDYSLRTINGSPLPYQFSDGTVVTSDVLTIDGNGTFTEDVQLSDGTIVPFDGTWVGNNGNIQFTDRDSGTTFTGSLSGSVLTEFFASGATYVFLRR